MSHLRQKTDAGIEGCGVGDAALAFLSLVRRVIGSLSERDRVFNRSYAGESRRRRITVGPTPTTPNAALSRVTLQVSADGVGDVGRSGQARCLPLGHHSANGRVWGMPGPILKAGYLKGREHHARGLFSIPLCIEKESRHPPALSLIAADHSIGTGA